MTANYHSKSETGYEYQDSNKPSTDEHTWEQRTGTLYQIKSQTQSNNKPQCQALFRLQTGSSKKSCILNSIERFSNPKLRHGGRSEPHRRCLRVAGDQWVTSEGRRGWATTGWGRIQRTGVGGVGGGWWWVSVSGWWVLAYWTRVGDWISVILVMTIVGSILGLGFNCGVFCGGDHNGGSRLVVVWD